MLGGGGGYTTHLTSLWVCEFKTIPISPYCYTLDPWHWQVVTYLLIQVIQTQNPVIVSNTTMISMALEGGEGALPPFQAGFGGGGYMPRLVPLLLPPRIARIS